MEGRHGLAFASEAEPGRYQGSSGKQWPNFETVDGDIATVFGYLKFKFFTEH
ncbi:rCG43100, isoform CRA_c [Rattus norvegicus]|uniref:RCG43100, isoform CRA_c n=1 Tax=Rattus norvegicus TaxID=10116 RepID=A6IWN4_RAT|nr:rCG43100, isoform CRA_c [Rattus norvegicus]